MNRYVLFSMICIVGCDIQTDTDTGTESGNPPVINSPNIETPAFIELPTIGKSDSSGGSLSSCESDDECLDLMNRMNGPSSSSLEEWGNPTDFFHSYESSYCGRADKYYEGINPSKIYRFGEEQGEPSCLCVDEDPKYGTVQRGDLLSPQVESDCLIRGRFNVCLFYKDEFAGCDLERPTESCEAVCQEVGERIEQDAQWDTNLEARFAKCLEYEGGSTCHIIIGDIEGNCYAFFGYFFAEIYNPLDCGLNEEELWKELEKDLSTNWEKNTSLPVIWNDTDEAKVEEYDYPFGQ